MVEREIKQIDESCDVPEHLTLLQQITPLARQINCLDIDRIGQVCVDSIPELIGVRFASIYLLNDGGHILHLLKNNHPFPINRIVSVNQTPPSPMILAIKSRDVVVIGDIDHHQRPVIRRSQRPFAGNYQTGNCIIAPLVCQDRVLGVMNFADRFKGTFDPNVVSVVELLSQLLGASVGNIKLFERMQRQATTDGLTGLANHRSFYDTLEKELWRARRFGGKVALIMIDADNLKSINDTYGHRAGDRVIGEVARRITHGIRQIDTAARYGGDEFAVILPSTKLKDAIRVAERMVSRVANTPVSWDNVGIPLSISVGVGEYDAESSPEEIMRHSDKALYAAKESGKNTVRVFGQLSE